MKSLAKTNCYFYGEQQGHGEHIVYCVEAEGLYDCPCNLTYYDEWDKPEPYECHKYISHDEVNKLVKNYVYERINNE